MSSPCTEFSRRAVGWVLPTALLAFAPKCLACIWAYAGLGAALGFGGREICGAPTTDSWPTAFALASMALGVGGFFIIRRRQRSL